MDNEQLINDLFEAARNEPPVRSLSSVRELVGTASASTSSSLVIKWLKQNKMNMLITTSGIIIAATILLYPKQEIREESAISFEEQTVQSMEAERPPVKEPEMESGLDPDSSSSRIREAAEGRKEVSEKTEEKNPPTSNKVLEVVQQEPAPQAKARPKKQQVTLQQEASKVELTEHAIILVSSGGKSSVREFSDYLSQNLSYLDHEFTSTVSKKEIKKFTLKLDNGREANFRMQVSGFDKLELHWESDATGDVCNVWYRLDSKEIKELDFSKSQKFSVRVKHKHEEF